jgi:homoserine dehydrogenase
MNAQMPRIRIGILGCGVVGSQVATQLLRHHEELSTRSGAELILTKIAVRDSKIERDGIDPMLLTTDARSIVTDPEIDLIVEVMGGIEPARELILLAIENGKSVVTANKALLATHGADLYSAADARGVDLYYEAAVAGAIPILRPLRESLVGDHVTRIMGIVNGTTNYILTKMDEDGLAFDEALEGAQNLGYAEADPTADIEGFDAAAKAAILAGLAFHTRVTATDVAVAQSMNHVIKLLAIAELTPHDEISVRVHPALIPRTHPLASVRNAYNAVFVEAEAAGELMFYGRGAGGAPTASAVLGDVVAVARHLTSGALGPRESDYADRTIALIDQIKTQYLIRLDVADKPGVLAAVAQAFATENVSIQTVRQSGRGTDAELIVVTHGASERALALTVKRLSQMDTVRTVESVIRVEGVVPQ